MNNRVIKRIQKIFRGGIIENVLRLYLKGRISAYSENEEFLYDVHMLKRLNPDSYSQFGQDVFIYWMVFGGPKTAQGIFMDIGGNDPIHINNTYFFEQRGWTGLAFEPVKSLADKWKGVRQTPCYNMALGMSEDEVEFTEKSAHEHSGIDVMKPEEGDTTYKIRQRKLSDVLKEEHIKHVDMVSIDVEGYEMNVLQGINFDEVDITCFCIENNEDGALLPNLALREFMVGKGYRLIARLTIDDIFIKNEYLVNLNTL